MGWYGVDAAVVCALNSGARCCHGWLAPQAAQAGTGRAHPRGLCAGVERVRASDHAHVNGSPAVRSRPPVDRRPWLLAPARFSNRRSAPQASYPLSRYMQPGRQSNGKALSTWDVGPIPNSRGWLCVCCLRAVPLDRLWLAGMIDCADVSSCGGVLAISTGLSGAPPAVGPLCPGVAPTTPTLRSHHPRDKRRNRLLRRFGSRRSMGSSRSLTSASGTIPSDVACDTVYPTDMCVDPAAGLRNGNRYVFGCNLWSQAARHPVSFFLCPVPAPTQQRSPAPLPWRRQRWQAWNVPLPHRR